MLITPWDFSVVLIVVGACLLLAWVRLLSGRSFPDRIQFGLTRLANRRTLSFGFLFLGLIVVRVSALPLLSVPIPGIHDEYSYLLMGDTFAHGRLTNPAHPLWRSFETFHVMWHPTYASIYPPVQGFVLALGELLGSPWIGVLLSCACMTVATYWMLRAWMPVRWAFLGGALTALNLGLASYWINSYWGGAAAAVGGALVFGALPRLLRRGRAQDSVLLGIGVAILANSRPYEGLFFCLVPALAFLYWLFDKKKPAVPAGRKWKAGLLPVGCILIATISFMGYYNWRLTRDPLLFPHTLNWREFHSAAMFVWQKPGPEKQYDNDRFEEYYNDWERKEYNRTLRSLRYVTFTKTIRFASAFLWWGACLIVPGLLGALLHRKMRLLWLSLFTMSLAVYLVTFSQAHYFAPATCVIYALIVESMRRLNTMRWGRFRWGNALVRASVVVLIINIGTYVAHGECDQQSWTCPRDYGRVSIIKKLQSMPGKHLVIVRYSGDEGDLSIHDEWVYNGANIDSQKIVWARELDEAQNQKLFAYFRDRAVWLARTKDFEAILSPYTPPER